MKLEVSEISDPSTFDAIGTSRRIGRTRSPIIAMEKAFGEVLLIKKADGSIYAITDLAKKTVRIK